MENEAVKNKENKIFVFIFSACFLLFIAILVLVTVSGAIKDIEIFEKANFVEVEATITEYKEFIDWDENENLINGKDYATFYEYRSPDGDIYSGCWEPNIRSEEEAKAQIGKKVPLYVDDELKLQTKSLKIDKTGVIVGVVFGSICLLASIGFFAYLIVCFARSKSQDKMIGVDYKENGQSNKPKNFFALHQVIILLSIFCVIGFAGSSISKEKNYHKYNNADFVEVVGEIYSYKEFETENSTYFVNYYKYVSDDGKQYTGMWTNDIYAKEDAESTIGSKVPLFYDKEFGALKSMSDFESMAKPDHTLNIILVGVFAVLLINSLVRFIRFIILNERYKKSTSHSLEDNYEQQI